MLAPIMPCASAGEISDALRRIETRIAEAAYDAEAIRDGISSGLGGPNHLARAANLHAELLGLAAMVGAIANASATPSQRAAA
ncbi:hypothetical protein [Methylorubrum suomiense]|uniref:Uncharacterized protein n=1 Tax=Methylorubrum suomiense TaxID=144191 RepID=A0ABQ4UYQ7_9HYPH|nr:hypothetical protein [Methylorubrum suomiense]GJE77476.1 hypothetical protein BGCPKDLD_4081 [Methylorubrum suomiense]